MILVTGSTGNVGAALLRRLAGAEAEVRALAHSEASRNFIEGLGVEAADGDFDVPETIARALVGCDQLFLLSPPWPDQATRETAAIDAAERAGVKSVVALSVIGSDPQSPAAICRWHSAVDEHLANSSLDYTILRPTGFMQVHLMPVATVRSSGAWYGMTGDGVAAYVDSEDVAAAAAAVLTSADHQGRTYDLTGPEAMTMAQAAAQLAEAIGGDVAYIELSAEQFHGAMLDAGLPLWLADTGVALYDGIRDGHGATVTNTVEQLTGAPARSYRAFLESHKDAFV